MAKSRIVAAASVVFLWQISAVSVAADTTSDLIKLGTGLLLHSMQQQQQQQQQVRPQQARPQQARPQSQPSGPDPATLRAMEIQRSLNTLGFDAGPVDGQPGRRTRAAIEAYQVSRGFPATGSLSDTQLVALKTDVVRQQSGGAHTRALRTAEILEAQSYLAGLGYNPGTPDGVWGPRSQAALDAFRRDNGIASVAGPPSPVDTASLYRRVHGVAPANTGTRYAQPQIATATSQAAGPSFDCVRASTPAEFTICANPVLAALDRQLAAAWSGAIATTSGGAAALMPRQRAWIASRDECGFADDCLMAAMTSRIVELGGTVAAPAPGAVGAGGFAAAVSPDGLAGSGIAGLNPNNTLAAHSGLNLDTSPAQTGHANSISQQQIGAAVSTSGIRHPEPVMLGDRVLTGTPLVYGQFNSGDTEIDGRPVPTASLNIALLADLMAIRQFPEIVEDERIAAQYAARFLEGPLRDRFYKRCSYPSCNTNDLYSNWVGNTEFERSETYRSFIQEIVPQLTAMAPESTLRTVDVEEVEIGQYNAATQSFPIRPVRPRTGFFGTVGSITTDPAGDLAPTPDRLPIPAAEAAQLAERFVGGQRRAYVVHEQDVGPIKFSAFGNNQTELPIVTTAVKLYADPLGQELIYDFDPGRGGGSGLALQDGVIWADGRIVVAAYRPSLDEPVAALPGTNDDQSQALQENFRKAIKARIEGDIDYSGMDDRSALDLLGSFPEEEQRAMIGEALQRAVTNAEYARISERGIREVTELRDPFAMFRLASAIRDSLTERQTGTGDDGPLPLRVYCFGTTDGYDFQRQVYPLRYGQCDKSYIRLRNSFPGVTVISELNPQVFPGELALPLNEAEAFRQTQMEHGTFMRFLMSFETDATISTRQTEAGSILTITYTPPANLKIHKGMSLTEVATPFPGPGNNAGGNAAGQGKQWHSNDMDQMASLAALAGAPRPLPFDASELSAGGSAKLGQLRISNYDSGFQTPGSGATTVALFEHRDGSRNTNAAALATALSVPADRIIAVQPGYNRNESIFALLPGTAGAYTIEIPADRYGRSRLSVHALLDVASVHRFQAGNAGSAVVVVATPAEALVTEHGNGPVIERFALAAVTSSTVERIEVPTRAALVQSIASAYGVDPVPIMEYLMAHPSGLNKIDERERFERLIASTAESADDGAIPYWLVGTARIGEYDFEQQAFTVSTLSVGLPELQRELDLKSNAIRTQIDGAKDLRIPVAREQAEQFESALPRNRSLPVRLRVRPLMASASTNGNLYVQTVLETAVFLSDGSDPTLLQEDRVLLQIGEPKVPPARPVTRRSQEEALAYLRDQLGDREGLITVRRKDLVDVERVFVESDVGNDYDYRLRDAALDWPKKERLARPYQVAEAIRQSQGAVYVLRTRGLFHPDPTGVVSNYETDIRPVLVALAQELDLAIDSFPPEPKLDDTEAVAKLEELLAGDPQYVLLTRRDGPKISQVYSHRTIGMRHRMPRTIQDAAKLGFTVTPELPDQVKSGRDLLKTVNLFLETASSALVLSPDDLKKVYAKLSGLDLVGRPYPPEEVHIGIAKDHKKTAADFELLGVTVGMEAEAAGVVMQEVFGSIDGSADDRLTAGQADCVAAMGPAPGDANSIGSRCMDVALENEKVVRPSVWQVIEGNAEEAVTEALKERFGRTPFMHEKRFLEGGAARTTLGWGQLVGGDREELGRVDAKFPPTVVEATIWTGIDTTTVFVQIDAEKALDTMATGAPAKIEF